MIACAQQLGEVIRAHRGEYVRVAARVVANTPNQTPGKYSETDLGQLVEGFVAVLTEALEERGSETKAFYIETVIPSLLANGDELAAVIHTVVGWTVYVIDDVTRSLPPECRGEAVAWLADFFAGYVADMVRVGTAVPGGSR